MIARTSNPWKKWGVIGFISIGAVYSGAAFLANISWLTEFGLYLNLAMTAAAGIVGGVVGSSLATARYYCQRTKINNQDLMKSLINSEVAERHSVFSSHAMMEQVFQVTHDHAAYCGNLVKDFHRELVYHEVDVKEYVKEADELKKEYLKRHPNDKLHYLAVLQSNGYPFTQEPAEIFSEKNILPSNSSLAIQISPSESPAISPTTRLFNSQPVDIKYLPNSSVHQVTKSI